MFTFSNQSFGDVIFTYVFIDNFATGVNLINANLSCPEEQIYAK